MNANPTTLPKIILASTSVFRKMCLEKLQIPFKTDKPEIDETRLAGESVEEMVDRLSLDKALKVAESHPNTIIIASDQSAALHQKALNKPLNYQNAKQQLKDSSGECVTFYTGLVVLDTRQNPPKTYQTKDITKVYFRNLTDKTIHNYLTLETPYQCAGSFKSEGLGISLFKKIENKDPNALIGLPLIELTSIFEEIGITLPFLPPPEQ